MKKLLIITIMLALVPSIYAQNVTRGMISGTFSFGHNKKVHFTQGYLLYQASTKTLCPIKSYDLNK